MRIGAFVPFLETAIRAGQKVLAVGPPGCGKTEGAETACARAGMDCLPVCCPLIDPSYVLGYPYRDPSNGHAGHLPYGVIDRALKSTKPTVILLDELGSASETVLKSVLRLVQFREAGDHKLPGHVGFVAASNDVGHGAGVQGMVEPLKDRFDTIVSVEPNIEDTLEYGLAHSWEPGLLAYLNSPAAAPSEISQYGALCDWKPQKNLARSGSTPRGWGMVDKWLKLGVKDNEVIAGAIGKGRAGEFLSFLDDIAKLPAVADILIDPDGCKIPENPAHKYAVCIGLAGALSGKTFAQILRYLKRPGFGQSLMTFTLRSANRAYNSRVKDGRLPKDYVPMSASPDWTRFVISDEGKALVQLDNDVRGLK